jgi:coenzyme F420-reducing hydrogenase gamma subunit
MPASTQAQPRPTLAVHKFSSCDGCQLALLDLGETLLSLPELVDIVHFAEAGPVAEEQPVDVALVEGSISTARDQERIQRIRASSRFLITIGACATAGGLQALRNLADADAWARAVYAQPEYLDSLDTATGIAQHVKVDLELWGCPVNSRQVLAALRDLLFGVRPAPERQPLCMECKRRGVVCTLVAKGEPCMGPVTRAGCGALCPSFGRACYACYGPGEPANGAALGQRLIGLGLAPADVVRRFQGITSAAPAFQAAAARFQGEQASTRERRGGGGGDDPA